MASIGSYEAKTHLPALLDRVANGEKIVITKRGKPVAMLVPVQDQKTDAAVVVREMLKYRDQHGPKLGSGLTVRKLIEDGRRY
jgi:prevent-host-death family protein